MTTWVAGFRRLGINLHGVPIYSGVIRNIDNPYAQWAKDCAQKQISEKATEGGA